MVTPMITALDLFCGAAGGWSLGLHRVGIRTVAACEIDNWRRAVFSAHNPGVRMYDDIRSLTAERLRADIGRLPDWIVGSPPCQDASSANTSGKGVDGERTGLFFEAVRLVGECRPSWCCFENVSGLRTRGADRVLAELEALGYTCWPLVVGAVHAGAPHRRQRVWIVAADLSRLAGGLHQGRQDQEGAPNPRGHRAWKDASDTHGAGLAQWQGVGGDVLEELPPAIRAVAAGGCWNGGALGLARGLRVADGLSAGMDRDGITRAGAISAFPPSARKAAIAAYGDAVLPQITEAIARSIISLSLW